MSRSVLTAVTDRWEGQLVTVLERGTDLDVARRCADLADLLAAAAAGLAAVAMVSADLRALDRAALAHLRDCGVAVVGVYPPGDEAAERHLRQLGIDTVVAADADGTLLQATVDALAPADAGPRPASATSAPTRSRTCSRRLPGPAAPGRPAPRSTRTGPARVEAEPPGVLLAVWGPTGAPGRTTLAVTLATELAAHRSAHPARRRRHLRRLRGPGRCRCSTRRPASRPPPGPPTRAPSTCPALARLAPEVAPGLRVLTGIPKAERWPELRAAARRARPDPLPVGWRASSSSTAASASRTTRSSATTPRAPRRNAATLTALALADHVVVVGAADPVGLQRLVRGLQELAVLSWPAADRRGQQGPGRCRGSPARAAHPRRAGPVRRGAPSCASSPRTVRRSTPPCWPGGPWPRPRRRRSPAVPSPRSPRTTLAPRAAPAGRSRWRRR